MRSLSDIIAYNLDHPDLELPPGPFPSHGHPPRPDESYADQSFLLKADGIEIVGAENSTYVTARSEVERIGWSEGLESYFEAQDGVDVMLVPTEGVAGSLASLARVPMITRSSCPSIVESALMNRAVPLSFLPSDFPVASNATWPLYPSPSMPYGIALIGSRGHGSHERLLEIARMLEDFLRDWEGGVEDRKGRMRSEVRAKL